jgi:hypothetical protein
LGDRNEHLPTMHGFDEWFGNLYQLNAEEDQKQSRFMKSFVVKRFVCVSPGSAATSQLTTATASCPANSAYPTTAKTQARRAERRGKGHSRNVRYRLLLNQQCGASSC